MAPHIVSITEYAMATVNSMGVTWTVRYTRGTNPLLSSSQRARSKLNAVKQFVGNDPELRVIVRLLGGDLGRSQKCFAIPLVAVSTHP